MVVEDGGEVVALSGRGAFRSDNLYDGGTDLSGFFNKDGIADTNIFSFDLLLIVKGGTGDRGS